MIGSVHRPPTTSNARASEQLRSAYVLGKWTPVSDILPASHLVSFEVLADEQNPDLFYLNEVYADVDAFNTHASGQYFGAFLAEVRAYAEGPTWLMRANLIGDDATGQAP